MKHQTYKRALLLAAILFIAAPSAYAAVWVRDGSDEVAAAAVLLPAQRDALVKGAQTDQKKEENEDRTEGGKTGNGTTPVRTDGEEGAERGLENATIRANERATPRLENAEFHMDLDNLDDGESIDVDEADGVETAEDFRAFVKMKSKKDERLKSVEVKNGKVEVEYEEPAKLFGFVGTKINARASVDKEGNTAVSYPWYHIFMKKHVSHASLQSAIARAIAGERKGEKEGIASTTMQTTISTALGIPNIFEIIADTLKRTSEEAETTASTE